MFDQIYIHNLKYAYSKYKKAKQKIDRYSGKNKHYRAIKEWRRLAWWKRIYAALLVKFA